MLPLRLMLCESCRFRYFAITDMIIIEIRTCCRQMMPPMLTSPFRLSFRLSAGSPLMIIFAAIDAMMPCCRFRLLFS